MNRDPKPEPRVDEDGVPWCARTCPLYVSWPSKANACGMNTTPDDACAPAVRSIVAERDRLAEEVRALRESWIAFGALTRGGCHSPIYYRKFDGCVTRNYGWTHQHWSRDVGYHATPQEAVDAAWRHGWDAKTRAAIIAEGVTDCFRNEEDSNA